MSLVKSEHVYCVNSSQQKLCDASQNLIDRHLLADQQVCEILSLHWLPLFHPFLDLYHLLLHQFFSCANKKRAKRRVAFFKSTCVIIDLRNTMDSKTRAYFGMRLTNFEQMVPHSYKTLPKRHVGPDRFREEDDDGRKTKHFPHREDKLLCFLRNYLIQTAHSTLKQH